LASVLVVNAGSTSLKLSLVDEEGSSSALTSLGEAPADIAGIGHRVVHGGPAFRAPVLLDDAMLAELRALVDLAPLHNAPALEAIDATRRAFPAVPQVAVFDTEFHATMPAEASTSAVPERWRTQWHIRRYGFHGLSVQWASEQVPVERLVVCHLGGGCSVSAVLDGRSVDTTMGFSPLEGVTMATRSGSLDPAAILYLLRRGAGSADEIEQVLERESGLLGLSGLSSGVEELDDQYMREAALHFRGCPAEVGLIAPHAVKDDCQLAGDGHNRLLDSTPLGDGHAPCLERVPTAL